VRHRSLTVSLRHCARNNLCRWRLTHWRMRRLRRALLRASPAATRGRRSTRNHAAHSMGPAARRLDHDRRLRHLGWLVVSGLATDCRVFRLRCGWSVDYQLAYPAVVSPKHTTSLTYA